MNVQFLIRLVTHSPLPRSSSCSPVEYSDPHASTLLQLLKNISEEVEDLYPNTNETGVNAIGSKSPLATLNSKLQHLTSTSPNVLRGPMGNLIPTKAKSTSPPKITKEVRTKKSSSLEDFNNSGINAAVPMKLGQNLGENLNLPVSEADQILPLIQITLTESQEKKKFTTDQPSANITMPTGTRNSS